MAISTRRRLGFPKRICGYYEFGARKTLTSEGDRSAWHRISEEAGALDQVPLPLAKDLSDFQFEHTPINETLVNELASGGFIAQPRNAVLVGGTGTGKTHLAIAIARSCIRSG